jgi:hypothetical protein
MSYRLESMRGNEVALPYKGDVLSTPEIAHAVSMATFEQMPKDVNATCFRRWIGRERSSTQGPSE